MKSHITSIVKVFSLKSFPPYGISLHFVLSLRAGELVLMDAGCEYHGYVSDITRTWPVSGQFTPIQKDLYEVVRATKDEITKVRNWYYDGQ